MQTGDQPELVQAELLDKDCCGRNRLDCNCPDRSCCGELACRNWDAGRIEGAVQTSYGTCGVTIRRPMAHATNGVGIVYLHGGGLLYGQRNDLPEPYVSLLLRHGYTLVCVDYPLAPQVGVSQINRCVRGLWDAVTEACATNLGLSRFVVCGRSAGAYLALRLADNLRIDSERAAGTALAAGTRMATGEVHATGAQAERGKDEVGGVFAISSRPVQPAAIIDFYGYCDLESAVSKALWKRSAYYESMPPISDELARQLIARGPVTSASISERFSLYVYARQHGTWGSMIGLDPQSAREESVPATHQALLPPTFIAASTGDKDVPFACSKRLSKTIPQARMFTAYYLEHDFDRDLRAPDGMRAWTECVKWLDNTLKS